MVGRLDSSLPAEFEDMPAPRKFRIGKLGNLFSAQGVGFQANEGASGISKESEALPSISITASRPCRHLFLYTPMETAIAGPFIKYRTDLPIFASRTEIVTAIRKHQVIVVTGETGCGKTTQLPLLCCEALGDQGRIAVTQPRRIAAVSIARRVAGDLGTKEGGIVGYRTRFDECVSDRTRILFQTDGMLLTVVNRDRFFNTYGAIIIDEAHERNLNIDLLIGHLRWLVKRRRDLRVIISSATINPQEFSDAFDRAPIIKVDGRTHPIETIYDPFDETELTVAEAATRAIEKIDDADDDGDILAFMPTERDIIAVKRLLEGRRLKTPSTVLPLFARLSRAHQDQLWKSTNRRKIVVATNIAETSITVPGIRFVVDSGLARIKRFEPNRRVTALPVEWISRASADQRAGRCGRTGPGVCIRLYEREAYESMAPYTPAEILRSNMAGVILTMQSRWLGPIEKFAFVEPPPQRAVNDGFAHLRELGALLENNELTPIGRKMAGYQLDPHLARMVVAAEANGTLDEVLVIAAALSTMDPRERPAEKAEAADAAHRRFADPVSDFVWYLNLWRAYHDEWKSGRSQARMRDFCSSCFLSFARIKEWRDVHAQLLRNVRPLKPGPRGEHPSGTFLSIHTALLTGLIATIAQRDEVKKNYRMSHGGDGVIFPGSGLAKKNPPWIMFAEKVETSRLFLRTAAEIDPSWIGTVAPHLVRRRYSAPFFDVESGMVRATEHEIVFGLTVGKKQVAYSRIRPEEASDIFIRDGLLAGLVPACRGSLALAHNALVVNTVMGYEDKLRVRDLFAGDEALFAFYKKRLPEIASIHDLNHLVRDHGSDAFLRLTEDDLLARPLPEESLLWPDTVTIGGAACRCTYRFAPVEPDDGVTVHLPRGAQSIVGPDDLQWLVRPLWESCITALFESLSKEKRKSLMPLRERAAACAQKLRKGPCSFFVEVARVTAELFGVVLTADDLRRSAGLPPHSRVHAVYDDERADAVRTLAAWERAYAEREKPIIDKWDFGDLPAFVTVAEDPNGLPLYGFPALQENDGCVGLVFRTSQADAENTHPTGVRALVATVLAEDFEWLGVNAKLDRHDRVWLASIGDADTLMKHAVAAVAKQFSAPLSGSTRSQTEFNNHIAHTRLELANAMRETVTSIVESGKLCAQTAGDLGAWRKKRSGPVFAGVFKDLSAEQKWYAALLADGDTEYELYRSFPRYLKRLAVTVTRAMDDPGRYLERIQPVRRFELALDKAHGLLPADRQAALRMVEEYKISIFAQQEVKAMAGTSEKKLKELFSQLGISL